MQQQEIDEELAAPGARELLAAPTCHLAYTGLDGTPRVVPVGFTWARGQVVLSTAEHAPKVEALQTRPGVALSFDDEDAAGGSRCLSVRGSAAIQVVDGLTEEYVAAARRTMGDGAAAFEEQSRHMYDRMARIAVTPTWVRFWDFGAGRLPRSLQRLAGRAQS